MDSVEKEMGAVRVAFKFLNDDDIIPPGYTEVKGSHLIFDIKMEDFRRKSRNVAGGYRLSMHPVHLHMQALYRERLRGLSCRDWLRSMPLRSRHVTL
jgi:hypothetical protein